MGLQKKTSENARRTARPLNKVVWPVSCVEFVISSMHSPSRFTCQSLLPSYAASHAHICISYTHSSKYNCIVILCHSFGSFVSTSSLHQHLNNKTNFQKNGNMAAYLIKPERKEIINTKRLTTGFTVPLFVYIFYY